MNHNQPHVFVFFWEGEVEVEQVGPFLGHSTQKVSPKWT